MSTAPRHILMTADTVGGVFTYAVELCRALARRNVRVSLATMGELPTPEQREKLAEIPGLELYPSAFKLEWMDDPWHDVQKAGEWLLELEARLSPDVVHLNGYAHGALPFRAPVVVVGHSCVYSWFAAVHGALPPERFHEYRLQVAQGLAHADLVVAPSRAMLGALEAHYGALAHKKVIYNAREARDFPPGKKEAFFFAAGRLWDEAKNIGALVKVAHALNWPVCIAGEARHPSGGSDFSASTAVELLGQLPPDEVVRWMARSSVYVLPARYEPFGLSALEAALAGCALVLGDIPSLREVWGDAALFVAPEDTDALLKTLKRLETEHDEREAMALAARERALRFTVDAQVERYLAAYRGLLSRDSRAVRADARALGATS